MRIAPAADHNGIALKARLIVRLAAQRHDADDRGADGSGGGSSTALRGRLPAGC